MTWPLLSNGLSEVGRVIVCLVMRLIGTCDADSFSST